MGGPPLWWRRDDGFSMVEAVVALALMALLIQVLAFGLAAGLRATTETKRYQQATALGNEAAEFARKATYAGLTMVDADINPANDPRIKTTCGTYPAVTPMPTRFVDPDGNGPLKCEAIVRATSGGADAINPHKATRTAGTDKFTVWRYVTWVDQDAQGGSDPDYKRMSVVVEWNTGRSYRISTLVSDVSRGLSAPEFDLAPAAQGKKVVRGHQVVFAHTIRNLGIADTYDLAMTEGPEAPTRSWAITLYRDVDQDGRYDVGLDTAFTDTNASGTVDTGPVATDQIVFLLAVWTLPTSETAGTESMKLRATSGIDPQFWKEATDTLEVRTTAIDLVLHLHNAPPGDTPASLNLPMTETAPTETTLFNYSTNMNSTPGRTVTRGTDPVTSSDTTKAVSWVFQMPTQTVVKGNVSFRIWVQSPGASCSGNITVNGYLRHKAGASDTAAIDVGSQSTTSAPVQDPPSSGQCPFRQITLTGTVDTLVDGDRWVEAKLFVPTSSGTDVVFAYGTTTYAAQLTLPLVSVATS